MKRSIAILALLAAGCGALVTEQRRAKLDAELRAIHHDFQALSATFSAEQQERYARARMRRDDPAFQEFYASLNEQQQAQVTAFLERTKKTDEEQQRIFHTVRREMGLRRQHLISGGFVVGPSVSVP